MIRTQVSLTEAQMARLRDAAARRGISIAAVVREAVDAHLSADPEDVDARWSRAASAVGRFRGDLPDVAARHDDYLDEAFGAKLSR